MASETTIDADAALDVIGKAQDEVSRICREGPRNGFRMSIPANEKRDSDLLISAGLRAGEMAVKGLLAARERLERQSENLRSLHDLMGETERQKVLIARLTRERDEAFESLGADDPIHGAPEDCPTWYDFCNCTVATLTHNIRRAETAEAEVARLRDLLMSGYWLRDGEQTFLRVRLSDGADLSCRATRENAINATLARLREQEPAPKCGTCDDVGQIIKPEHQGRITLPMMPCPDCGGAS